MAPTRQSGRGRIRDTPRHIRSGQAEDQALTALQHFSESRARHEQAIDLRFDLRMAFMPLGAFQRALDILREAEILASTLDDQR